MEGFGLGDPPLATALSRLYLRGIFQSSEAKRVIMIAFLVCHFCIIRKNPHATKFSRIRFEGVVLFKDIFVRNLLLAER